MARGIDVTSMLQYQSNWRLGTILAEMLTKDENYAKVGASVERCL